MLSKIPGKLRLPFFLFLTLFLNACDSDRVYEENADFQELKWLPGDSLVFDFSIQQASLPYDLLYDIRYSVNYPYYNLYVKHSLKDSAGHVLDTQLMNMNIFDPKTGVPKGSGLGDIFDYRILFLKDYSFPYTGKYKLVVRQYMRDEPLKGIEAFGLRVEKAKK